MCCPRPQHSHRNCHGELACLAAGWAVAQNGPLTLPLRVANGVTQVLWSVAPTPLSNTSLHYRGAVRAVAYVLIAHVCIQIVRDTRTRHVDHWPVPGLFAGEAGLQPWYGSFLTRTGLGVRARFGK